MKKWIYSSLSFLFLALFLLAYQNCGKSLQSGSTSLPSTDPSELTDGSDGVSDPDTNASSGDSSTDPTGVTDGGGSTPVAIPPAPIAPAQCPARSPLKNQLQNLASVVDRAAILDSFPADMTAPLPTCSLQALPDTLFRPPLRTAATFRSYMDAWVTHASYIMIAADAHLRLPNTHPRKAELANCVLEHLHQIATRNLFTEPRDSYSDNQGEYERSWMIGSLSVSLNKIRREASLPAARVARVQTWLATAGLIVMDKFNRHIDGRPQNRDANIYWAGVTLMSSGINTSNATMYNRGVEFIRMGLDQIQANGVLPLEMTFGAEAFRRHVFSLQALIFAAQMAKLNNLDLFAYRNNALMRLADLVINSFRDFNQFQSLTRVTQTYLPAQFLTQGKWDLVWMEIYFAHTGDVDLIPYLNVLRPMRNHRTGNTTIAYGLRCLDVGP